ncbi:MAG: hypothetical protein RMK00_02210 [Bacteroidota bacterium]|nr:hypothetical protein [Candidatus Kapabacteria bacterium]MCX7936854.1 hypothetical protein [Chlorobiota bacterium]MDW8074573.1 hypothetical protein [Bacteroidota bacterium]
MGTLRFIACYIASTAMLMAQESAPLAVASYLLRPISARAVGLGGMQVACADEPTAIFSNPALLGYLGPKSAITGGVTALAFGRSLTNIAATFELSSNLSIGGGILGMNQGTITRRDLDGTLLGSSTIWQGSANVGATYRLTTETAIGLSGRVLLSTAPDPAATGNGAAIDAGIVTSFLNIATVGLSVQNLGFMKIGAERFSLPWMIRLGICSIIPFSEQTVAVTSPTLGNVDTVSTPSSEYLLIGIEAFVRAGASVPTIVAGIEVVPHELVSLRSGVTVYGESLGSTRIFPQTLLGGGISLRLPLSFSLRVDYALAHSFTASLTHTLSLVAEL